MRRDPVRVVIPEVVDPDEAAHVPEGDARGPVYTRRKRVHATDADALEALRRTAPGVADFVQVIAFAGAVLEAADRAGAKAERTIRAAHREATRDARARLRGGRK